MYKYEISQTSLWSSMAGDNHKVALPSINIGGVVFSPSTVQFVCDMFQVFSNMLKLGQGSAGDSNSWKSSLLRKWDMYNETANSRAETE